MKTSIVKKSKQTFIPALGFNFLTPSYDFLCSTVGLGNKYHKRLVSAIGNVNHKRVLDGGCATAKITILVKEKNPEIDIYAIDPDSKALEIAKKNSLKYKANIKFQKAFLQNLPFSSNYFDVVYSSLVIHHIPPEYKLNSFKEVRRVLKKNGVFLISDFGKPRNFFESLMPWFAAKFEHGKENYRGEIPDMLRKAGFTKVKSVGRYSWGIKIIKAYK